MANISNTTASRMKGVFPFFKLSPELRNRIYRALSEDHKTDASFGNQNPLWLSTASWYGHARPRPLLICRQFRDEYTTEIYRHLRLNLVMFTLVPADQEEDDCFAQALLRHTPTVPLLDHVKTFTLAIGVRQVWLPADELDGDPDFLTPKLHALLPVLPTLQTLNIELLFPTRTTRHALELDFTSDHPLLHPPTASSLSFPGTLHIYGFVAISIYHFGDELRTHCMERPRVWLGIQHCEIREPSVLYRLMQSQDPEAWLGMDFEVLGRAGDDYFYMTDRGTPFICEVTGRDYEMAMQRDGRI
ncbi:hypothetical protein B0A48_16723 [Cryoendolithus antarcticus]|uniref:Uncharacterized protein n=1 Tax=Cryoendolithus antarcticus TaxID=1507870 RepID=A0A1V8SDF1_9PEZI|nr:hypothetical protein B0A48_16723 [Cryoendolithus antarcticus]